MTVELGREQFFQPRLILGGMWGAAPLLSIFRRTASLSYFVTVREFGGKRPIEQTIGARTIGHLAAGQQEGNRATAGVGQRMDFCGASAARAGRQPNGMLPRPCCW